MGEFEEFCGSLFWNESLTWNTTKPYLTPCFHKTVLSWAPTLAILILLPYEIGRLRQSISKKIPWNIYNISKIILTLTCIVTWITHLILLLTNKQDDTIPDVDYVTSSIFIIGFSISLGLLISSLHFGIVTQRSQFFFYLLSTTFGGLTLHAIVTDNYPYKETVIYPDQITALFSCHYACVCLLFILNLFADATPKYLDPRIARLEKPPPQISSSFFATIAYTWITPFMWKGYRTPLKQEDLYDIDPKFSSEEKSVIFERNMSTTDPKKMNPETGRHRSLFPSIFKTFGSEFFLSCTFKVMADLLAVASPQVN